MRTPRILITSGEPAGIGPDICVTLAQSDWPCELLVAGDEALLADAAAALNLPLELRPHRPGAIGAPRAARSLHRAGLLEVLHVPLQAPVRPGEPDPRNARYVLDLLDAACDGCRNGEYDAMVTAPLQKSVIMDAGIDFTGHTEYLAQRCQAPLPVMMLAGGELRVALVTTHLPLAQVPTAITAERLEATLRIVHRELAERFGIPSPRLLLLGLNPHAGEAGHLGREEIEVITPVAERLRREGIAITGPVPADTAFTAGAREGADAIVAMYHDQGLPVLKYAAFDTAVNITLGLPIIRTSVDHGTALNLARSGRASDASLRSALACALSLVR
ncbi:MAG: 4-hydroxythreonine-4-phosphate dehydrogenase PdxA [Steroidobacteraceae bacterium]